MIVIRKRFCIVISLMLALCVGVQPIYAAPEMAIYADQDNDMYLDAAEEFMEEVEVSEEAKEALDEELSLEAKAFLHENNVTFENCDEETMEKIEHFFAEDIETYGLNRDVLSFKETAEANGFSEKQIQDFIQGMLTAPRTVLKNLFEDEEAIEVSRPVETFSSPISKGSGISPQSITKGPVSSERNLFDPTPEDGDNGGGYEVKSKAGYYKTTSYLTLPTFTNFYSGYTDKDHKTAGYMMFSLGNTSGTRMDIGISYSKGNNYSGSPKFRMFYCDGKLQIKNPNADQYKAKFKEVDFTTSLTQGQNVYMIVEKIEDPNDAYNKHVMMYIVNAVDFTQCYGWYYYDLEGINNGTNTEPGYSTDFPANAGVINRQITLCDATKNFNNGTKMNNAVFWNSWLYATSGYNAAPNSSNTNANRRGAFVDKFNKISVNVNWYAAWNEESVSIHF